MSKRITIKEIAKKANVSIGTVDRVIHNRTGVSELTKEKIRKIMKEGNYSSNLIARQLKLNKTYNIAILLPKINDYWNNIKSGIDDGCLEYESLGFKSSYFFFDNTKLNSLESAIKEAYKINPEGIILAPTILDRSPKIIETLIEKNIPFVFVDSNINSPQKLSFIGQDAFQSGKLAASLLVGNNSDSYEICIVTFNRKDLLDKTNSERILGFKEYFKNLQTIIHDINITELEEVKDKIIAQNKNIHIFVPNSKSDQLPKSIFNLNKQNKLKLVGYDLTDTNIKLLQSGEIDYLIYQKPKLQGYLSIQCLYKHLILNMTIPKNQFISLDIITKENIMYCQ
nr:LacI family DNA-binding transcriptional regulator [uncultured Marinifilum sp.]